MSSAFQHSAKSLPRFFADKIFAECLRHSAKNMILVMWNNILGGDNPGSEACAEACTKSDANPPIFGVHKLVQKLTRIL